VAVTLTLAAGGVFAQPGPVSNLTDGVTIQALAESQAITDYWTPERMKNAIPKEPPARPVTESGGGVQSSMEAVFSWDAVPGFAPGWKPGKKPQPDANAASEITSEDALAGVLQGYAQPQTSPPFSPPASPTDFGNYAPFQRWTWDGNYLQYPVSTVGKLFFTQNGKNFVCSASVINKSTLATAGHCVHAGNNLNSGWSTNVLFCPSYNTGGINPSRGCWAAVTQFTSFQWFNASNFDRDYGCIVTQTTGTVVADRVGNVTGWLGRAWNWPSRQATLAWGYPAGAPFTGNRIITTASTEWYQLNMNTSETQLSKYIGNDMTGGSSGGPWWLNMAHRSVEIADTDGSNLTDPFQGSLFPLINGVNSHKRCNAAGCPAGSLFTQEMGSPQFRKTTGDINESEDVFTACFNNGGTL
jgi:V8-like Glu-specific endopeptidase